MSAREQSTSETIEPNETISPGGVEEPLPEPPTMVTSLRQKDYQKLHNFFVQAVCGPYMAIYRSTGQLPSSPGDANRLKYYLANYLNDTHAEVITGANNDEYIRTIFEDSMSHHSIDCIIQIVFQLGSQMIDHLVLQIEVAIEPCDDPSTIPPERVDALRNLISGIVESATPNFSEIFDHPCHGQSIADLKLEMQTGGYVPPFTFSASS
jgi:hypothetical protein